MEQEHQPPNTPKPQATTVENGNPGSRSAGEASRLVTSPGTASTGMPHTSADSHMPAEVSSAGGRSTTPPGQRSQFDAFELAIVLSHYDTGIIEALQAYPRGSRKAPKLVFRSDTGTYLLKRRAPGRHDAFKVAFCHALQFHLAERQFPLPQLIGTKKDNNSMLQWKGNIYELFEYIKGTHYDQSLEATHDAGKTLALFHKLLTGYQPEYDPPRGSYHGARSVAQALNQMPTTLRETHPDISERQRLAGVAQYLHETYNRATQQVEDAGLAQWPVQIVHSDWHPGNMLFRGSRVVAVIDYDSARLYPRIIVIANGALQFSMIAKGEDPRQWPDYIDESRFKRFVRGYDSVYAQSPAQMLSRAELRVMPWLMIEALIAESAIPIATTGSFARLGGAQFLDMVQRKVRWIEAHADKLIAMVDA